MKSLIIRLWSHFKTDSLFRNSIYLMASMAVMGVLGFVFWIIVARVFPTGSVGIATALISVMALISNFSLLGFNISLVHYLPTSDQKNEKINSILLLIACTAILTSSIFLIGLKIFSPHLLFLQTKLLYILTFILFVVAACVNTIIDSIFIAYRASGNVLIKNAVLSIFKLFFPLFFIFLGAYGIFTAISLATLVSIAVSFVILFKKYQYSPALSFNISIMKKMATFSTGNYIGNFLSQAPGLILPILIVNRQGSTAAAYYYVGSMILAFLMIISQSTTQSLFAEGSYDLTRIRGYFLKALKIIFTLLIPSIIAIVLFGDIILHAFGKNYASQAFLFLKIISVSAIFMSICSLGNSLLRLRHQIKDLIIMNGISAIVILCLSYFFMPYGLTAVGWAWLFGQIILAILYMVFLWKKKYL